MTSLVDFLTARIDEDEHWAQRTQEHAAREADEGRITVRRWLPKGMGQLHNDPHPFPDDPARVLRECAAKRRLVNYWDLEEVEENPNTSGLTTNGLDADSIMAADAQFVLRVLAAVYADHEHYNPEWTP